MITTPNKLGGFPDDGNRFPVGIHGPHPGPGQDVPGRIDIPMDNESAVRTVLEITD